MDQFDEQEIINFLRNSLSLDIIRFDSSSLEIRLSINGKEISTATADVPAYEIRTGE